MERPEKEEKPQECFSMPKLEKDITILLLGETGVGKSTWINGFANFMEYDSLKIAQDSPTLCLIPASFMIIDDYNERHEIRVGSDENEVTVAGKSATQLPQTYKFEKDGHTVTLIDTPGMGDVRGIEKDKRNLQLILDHISHLKYIDGICILLKPNNARLNVLFTFCIKELLANLHFDAIKNIFFCFTNSRSAFFKAGDTLPALESVLSEKGALKIDLNRSTIYCMDNESVRFLYALKAGVEFSAYEKDNYEVSWKKSAKEIHRLLTTISKQKPHDVTKMLSLHQARMMIHALSKPLVEISRNIQQNIVLTREKLDELTHKEYNKEDLTSSLIQKRVEVHEIPFGEARTVCSSSCCVDFVRVETNGMPIIHRNYTQFCHGNCSRGKKKHMEIIGVVGHKSLQKCSAFKKDTGMCRTCGCYWEFHVKMVSSTVILVNEYFDKEKHSELYDTDAEILRIKHVLKKLQDQLVEYKQEQTELTTQTAKLACFLKQNSIRPYNDAIIRYIEHFIEEETKNVSTGGNNQVLKGLEGMKKHYEEEIRLLESVNERGTSKQVNMEQLKENIDKLFSLKNNGKKLREMMNTTLFSGAAFPYIEKNIRRGVVVRKTKLIKRKPFGDMFTPKSRNISAEKMNSPSTMKPPVAPKPVPLPRKKPAIKQSMENGIAEIKQFINTRRSEKDKAEQPTLQSSKTGDNKATKEIPSSSTTGIVLCKSSTLSTEL